MTKRKTIFLDKRPNGGIDYTNSKGATTHLFGELAAVITNLINAVLSRSKIHADGHGAVIPSRSKDGVTVVWEED